MFGSKKSAKSVNGLGTLIARNTTIEGKVKFTGTLRIEGMVVGDVIATDDKESIVEINVDGKVRGEVRSPDVVINGHVEGDVYAAGQLVLASDAVVDGNVHYNLIEMEKGAQINGNMVHSNQKPAPESAMRLGKRVKPELENTVEQQELAAS